MEGKVLYKDLSFKIVGLLFEVHGKLGRYRNEKQYADYFEEILKRENIKFDREYRFDDVRYGGEKIRCICDFIIEQAIILEFKVKDFIGKDEYFQVKRYLASLNLELAIIVNFRQPRIAPKRILNSNYYRKI